MPYIPTQPGKSISMPRPAASPAPAAARKSTTPTKSKAAGQKRAGSARRRSTATGAAAVEAEVPQGPDYSALLALYEQAAREEMDAAKKQRTSQTKTEKRNWDRILKDLKGSYEELTRARREDYDKNLKESGVQYADDLHDAWTRQMAEGRKWGQRLAASGLNGGASESAALAAENENARMRAQLYENRQSALKELLQALNEGLAADKKDYLTARSDARQKKQTALGKISTSYNAALAKARQQLAKNKASVLAKQLSGR